MSAVLAACSPTEAQNQSDKPTGSDKPVATLSKDTAPVPSIVLPDFTQLVEQQGQAVVNISTSGQAKGGLRQQIPDDLKDFFRRFSPQPFDDDQERAPRQSLGSGFIVSKDGYILTNAHVVAEAEEVTVKLTDRREFKAKVIGIDKRTDVAVVKIDAKDLPTVRLGDPSKLRVGEWVVAIGSPFGLESTVTAGIVSAKGRSLPSENYVPFIQTDVAVNPGNSGGPLFNLKGEVVGINSQIFSRTGGYMGLSFAIPIDVALDVTDQLRNTGKVTRGRLGIRLQPLTHDLAKSFGLADASGALVNEVEKGSPAERAGFKSGDVILKYDGKPVESTNELPRMVGATRPGTEVSVGVWRDGKKLDLKVKVGEIGADAVAQAGGGGSKDDAVVKLGLVVSELSGEQRQQAGVEHGLVVEKVDGPAARAGVRRGDVIVSVGAAQISSARDLEQAVQKAGKGAVPLLIKRGGSSMFIAVTPAEG
jgi:serine protease Do